MQSPYGDCFFVRVNFINVKSQLSDSHSTRLATSLAETTTHEI
ncbi:hypothetical protein PRUB_a4435 [Pseudoalteromonas rubra]|uniref:Uncharacterized protein n=1 Tax=Pseudoalteromonas rubra TaxID=43658 RepID=A0A8T0C9A6_9GAMM|nr:hypothetical protein PRUB_a4435 [Pseudoalteromonas rubra]